MLALVTRYKKEKLSAYSRLEAGSQVYKTSAGVVEAALIGRGSSVLIAHGSGGGYDMGLWLAQFMGGQFQYIAPSRFGYLRTPVPAEATPEAQAESYAALLDTLNVQAVIIVGLSAGGPSALQFALRHPGRCKGLMMVSAASRPVPPLPPVLRAMYPWMLKSDLIPWLFYAIAPKAVFQANGVSRALQARIQFDREKMRLLDALYQTTFPTTPRGEGMINDLQQLTNFPLYPIERITVPALVVHAVNDPIIPIESGEFSARTIPNARFIKLEDGGHFACVTHGEETLPEIQGFLKRHGD
jgi:2-hydroxy-6-oxonona-2,4-dienedioate hydrolase